jgi:hypothetical protein
MDTNAIAPFSAEMFDPAALAQARLPANPWNAGGEVARALAAPPVRVRPATLADLPFIDALQRVHTHMVGWFPKRQMTEYIEGGHVLMAEEDDKVTRWQGDTVSGASPPGALLLSPPHPVTPSPHHASSRGYIIFKDEYLKRDDVGIIYQLNVSPGSQRGLIGAMLVQHAFERSARGCRLFCCWCAQDIRAGYFWEALGFVPLAFRSGSRDKQRIHIFWQRRVRGDDAGPGATPYWFPYRTDAGAVREDRIVLPIPPGLTWRDPLPVVVPKRAAAERDDATLDAESSAALSKALSEATEKVERERVPRRLPAAAGSGSRPVDGERDRNGASAARVVVMRSRGALGDAGALREAEALPGAADGLIDPVPAEVACPAPRPRRATRSSAKARHEPGHIRIAREVRDLFLEGLNAGAGEGGPAALPPAAWGKWDVSREDDA